MMNLTAAIGLLIFVVILALLLKSELSPLIVFTMVPVIGALLAGYSLSDISDFTKSGFSSVMTNVIVTVFAILYFSIMADVGMFEVISRPALGRIGKSKRPACTIIVVAVIVAAISHMDGAGTTTIMVTLPMMMPFFDKMHMDRRALALAMGIVVGAMNLLPWTGPTRYTAIVLGMDPVDVWRYILPAQGIMLVIGLISAYLLGLREIKHGALNSISEDVISEAQSETREPSLCAKKRGYLIFNLLLTITLIAALVLGVMNSAIIFMLFTCIALIVDYPSKSLKNKKLKEFSPNILSMGLYVIAVGVLIGIMQEGGFVEALASAVVGLLPEAVGSHIYLIIAFLATPLLMMLGTSSYYQGLLPVVVGICTQYGINPLLAGCVILVPSGVAVCLSPLVAANHVSSGLLNFSLGDFIKYAWKWVLVISWIAIPITYFTVSLFL